MNARDTDSLSVCIDAIHRTEVAPAVAFVDEAACIGCTLCIQACPVDAIVGAAGQMHTVVAGWCTGCELCFPPCPVDCLTLVTVPERVEPVQLATDKARKRYERRQQRLSRDQLEKAERLTARAVAVEQATAAKARQTLVAAAIEQARRLNSN